MAKTGASYKRKTSPQLDDVVPKRGRPPGAPATPVRQRIPLAENFLLTFWTKTLRTNRSLIWSFLTKRITCEIRKVPYTVWEKCCKKCRSSACYCPQHPSIYTTMIYSIYCSSATPSTFSIRQIFRSFFKPINLSSLRAMRHSTRAQKPNRYLSLFSRPLRVNSYAIRAS